MHSIEFAEELRSRLYDHLLWTSLNNTAIYPMIFGAKDDGVCQQPLGPLKLRTVIHDLFPFRGKFWLNISKTKKIGNDGEKGGKMKVEAQSRMIYDSKAICSTVKDGVMYVPMPQTPCDKPSPSEESLTGISQVCNINLSPNFMLHRIDLLTRYLLLAYENSNPIFLSIQHQTLNFMLRHVLHFKKSASHFQMVFLWTVVSLFNVIAKIVGKAAPPPQLRCSITAFSHA